MTTHNFFCHEHCITFNIILQVIQSLALPRLRVEGERIKNILESPLLNAIDRTAAEHLRGLLVVSIL